MTLNLQWYIHTSSFSELSVFPTVNFKFFEGKEPEPFLSLYSSVQNGSIQILPNLCKREIAFAQTNQKSKLDMCAANFKTTDQFKK